MKDTRKVMRCFNSHKGLFQNEIYEKIKRKTMKDRIRKTIIRISLKMSSVAEEIEKSVIRP